jgi:hypothetical protein
VTSGWPPGSGIGSSNGLHQGNSPTQAMILGLMPSKRYSLANSFMF